MKTQIPPTEPFTVDILTDRKTASLWQRAYKLDPVEMNACCQSASNFDPGSASNIDPGFSRRRAGRVRSCGA